jgi:hypothetical protein
VKNSSESCVTLPCGAGRPRPHCRATAGESIGLHDVARWVRADDWLVTVLSPARRNSTNSRWPHRLAGIPRMNQKCASAQVSSHRIVHTRAQAAASSVAGRRCDGQPDSLDRLHDAGRRQVLRAPAGDCGSSRCPGALVGPDSAVNKAIISSGGYRG